VAVEFYLSTTGDDEATEGEIQTLKIRNWKSAEKLTCVEEDDRQTEELLVVAKGNLLWKLIIV